MFCAYFVIGGVLIACIIRVYDQDFARNGFNGAIVVTIVVMKPILVPLNNRLESRVTLDAHITLRCGPSVNYIWFVFISIKRITSRDQEVLCEREERQHTEKARSWWQEVVQRNPDCINLWDKRLTDCAVQRDEKHAAVFLSIQFVEGI